MSANNNTFQRVHMVTLLVFWSFAATAQDPREILLTHLKKVSGDTIGRWEAVHSMCKEDLVEFNDPSQANRPNFSGSKPSFHKYYWVYPDKTKNEIYTDSVLNSSFFYVGDYHFMVIGNMEPQRINNMPAFEFEAVRTHRMLKEASVLVYLGIRKFPTGDCHHIEIGSKKGTRHLYINVDTFFIDYSGIVSGEGDENLDHYYNYQQIDRLWYALSTTSSRNGFVYFSINTRKLQLNPHIPDSEFIYKRK